MIREEEMINEVKNRYANDTKCYDAFLHGFEFSDRHPDLSHLWHDWTVIPKLNRMILYETIFGDIGTWLFNSAWFPKNYVKRWAYLDDIIPKGGEHEAGS